MKNIKPVLSVIVPVYNAADTLDRTMESILASAYRDFEVILVNDGSRDNSREIAEKWTRRDERVILIDKKNGGAGDARNAALDKASGDYLYFADADDTVEPEAFQRMLEAAGESHLVIARYRFDFKGHCAVRGLVRENTVWNETEYLTRLIKRPGTFYFSALWNKLYRADIIRREKLFFRNDLKWGEDFDFNMRYAAYVKQASVLETPVYRYIKKTDSTCMQWYRNIWKSCRIKWELFKSLRSLAVKKGMYPKYAFYVWRYILNVTLTE